MENKYERENGKKRKWAKKKKMGKLGKIASDKLITAEEEKVNKK